jgi:tetratricopeptide (TPR) repeat protein
MLSDQEIKYLIEKAESHIDSRNFEQALRCYDQLIENAPPHPHFFKQRAYVNQMIDNVDGAIKDTNIAIELDPDEGEYYSARGALLSYKLTLDKDASDDSRKHLLEKIIRDYKASIERNPSNPVPWLDLIEMNIILHKYDEAVSLYGACKPYVDSKEYKLIRAWLGCIALIFSGDPIEEEDKKPLYDQRIRLKKTHWRVAEIARFLEETGLEEGCKEKSKKANEVLEMFIGHFDENPW